MKKYKPEIKENYYYVNLTVDRMFSYCEWTNDEYDNMLLERGLIFKTKEEVLEEAKVQLDVVIFRSMNKNIKH